MTAIQYLLQKAIVDGHIVAWREIVSQGVGADDEPTRVTTWWQVDRNNYNMNSGVETSNFDSLEDLATFLFETMEG